MKRNGLSNSKLNEPWKKNWPIDGLEAVNHCPICGQFHREILYQNLVDNSFRSAPGMWTLWRCLKCNSAYLDPRPTEATIQLAYANYYTHQGVDFKDDYAVLSPLRKLRRQLVNGYTNWRYATFNMPTTNFGIPAAFIMPSLRKIVDHQYRHLPKFSAGKPVLLDVGCGDGSFLLLARNCGYSVLGLEPDSKAAAKAAQQGLTVYESGIEQFDGKTDMFDVITMSHVIEHVHDPMGLLKACHALLKPGGQLWLETPNINSCGHTRFRENWRGLETPRHLFIFNLESLCHAIVQAGFLVPVTRMRPNVCRTIYEKSFAMERGLLPSERVAMPGRLKVKAAMAACVEFLMPSRREFITVTACKKGQ